ncbi:hypothetical protein NO559_02510 [Dasania sp. GY-MA-18]|uniref:DUF802 domain-containing protein n=1 Tax=Dasania phycosphaerae TaxID=2950436 RepID=A0A9J6RHB3_9GAMM|nr:MULTISPECIES: hypothetical protein [Dasania]MCR8921626.1 hypothetical protein [Dasania sp. GY-MA-18]MCZ0864054.1 hypothetical protein [Dasania phycosphaerae]MCZ0867782.1 hypothetical protein [Dasania phycosphaerae]
MTRFLFTAAFLLGATAIIWMSSSFVGSNALALSVTLLIAFAYCIGAFELFQYRQQSASLHKALNQISGPVENLNLWLEKLDGHLINPVRARIEGQNSGLPAPLITPYLIGLLVMLGLLGTFLGMVDTLKGAVTALEGTTELQAIRAGLAAPIQGLGLAFGTSVAGVAASAMLGLMSTLSRKERIAYTEQLDSQITKAFKNFSLAHNKQQTYNALQVQATALPDVADKLNVLADKLVTMSANIEQSLTAQQQAFHESVSANYSELANSIDASLKQTLAESGKLAGENIKPIIQNMMAEIKAETSNTHQTLNNTVQQQLSELRSNWQQQQLEHDQAKLQQWTENFEQLNLAANQQFTSASQQLVEELKQVTTSQKETVQSIASEFANSSASLNEQWQQANQQTREQQQAITHSLNSSSEKLSEQLSAHAANTIAQITQLIASSEQLVASRSQSEQQWLSDYRQQAEQQYQQLNQQLGANAQQNLEQMNQLLASAEQIIHSRAAAEQHWLSQHQQRADELSEQLAEQLSSNTQQNLAQISSLVASTEELVKTRSDSESQWLSSFEQRLNNISETLSNSLSSLREDEAQRGQAAIARLAELESKVTEHLNVLGQGLEQPMTELIALASKTPKAAAEVIEQLRDQVAKNIERENNLLEERNGIMLELDKLSASLVASSSEQQAAITQLVQASEQMLEKVGEQFQQQVQQQVSSLADTSVEFSGNAVEMASMAEAFNQAVQRFDESNSGLIENLNSIENSLNQSSQRSDEQLAYYVAQARDIIDHSIVSQKAMFDEIRGLGKNTSNAEAEVA